SNPTAHGIPIAQGASPFNLVTLGAGQLLIGTTASDPVAAALTAGTGITISSISGSITLSVNYQANYNEITGTSATMAPNGEYTANNVALVTLTLPTTAVIGSKQQINYKGTGGWKIAQNLGQQIQFGNVTTTSGTGGFIQSSAAGDCITLVCITANALWEVQAVQGSPTFD